MRRFLLSVVLLFLFLGPSGALAQGLDLFQLYQETGATLQETEFQAWLRLSDRYNEPDVDKLLAQVATDLGFEVKGAIQTSSFRDNFEQAFVMVDFFEAEGWLTVQRMQNLTLSKEVETFLGLRALRTGTWPSLSHYRDRVTSDFLGYGPEADLQFFTTLIGTLRGELSAEARKEITDRVKAKAQAKVIESYRQDNLESISLYTEHLPDRQKVGEKVMNLHLAYRYNQFENCTYIYLGTPIIAPDY
ncbi:MAG: YwmB family TATA-box binding protein [Firmicutes bacterium]|nr:YwmB family TATA-box binding protein [Bacillota bacterium]